MRDFLVVLLGVSLVIVSFLVETTPSNKVKSAFPEQVYVSTTDERIIQKLDSIQTSVDGKIL